MPTDSTARIGGCVSVPMVRPRNATTLTPTMIMISCDGVKAMAAFCARSASIE
jgi:hypothetical protein